MPWQEELQCEAAFAAAEQKALKARMESFPFWDPCLLSCKGSDLWALHSPCGGTVCG